MNGTETKKTKPEDNLIMIVDDEEAIIELFRHTLEPEGFKITSATNGQIAMDKVRKEKPNLVIVDLMMPLKGGYEVIKDLQSEPEYATIPVIVVTARSIDETTKQMLLSEPNVVDFFQKPIKGIHLISKVHNVLNTKSKDERFVEDRLKEADEILKKIRERDGFLE